MTNEILIEKAKRGDPTAFEQLVKPCEKLIWRVCWQMMGNEEDARDAMQEAMLKAWRSIGTYRADSAFSTWLYRVATSSCLDILRKRKIRQAESLDSMADAGYDPPETGAGPEQTLIEKERREELRAALRKLPHDMRIPLILSVVEGRSYEEIAEVTGQPIGTVKSRISRARLKLRELCGNNRSPGASKPLKGGE